MKGRHSFCCGTVETNKESSIPLITAHFVDTGFFTGKVRILTRKTELRINLAFAFHFADFYVGDVR